VLASDKLTVSPVSVSSVKVSEAEPVLSAESVSLATIV
jgi:hypothetical protein